MKREVSKLKGKALDAAVALANGDLVTKDEPGWPKGDLKRLRKEFGGSHVVRWYGSKGELGGWEPLKEGLSRDWNIVGPILHREKLMVEPVLVNGVFYGEWRAVCMSWKGRRHSDHKGRTPLEAAMRCYVAAVLCGNCEDGDVVEF
jgi:hypothetical protein